MLDFLRRMGMARPRSTIETDAQTVSKPIKGRSGQRTTIA